MAKTIAMPKSKNPATSVKSEEPILVNPDDWLWVERLMKVHDCFEDYPQLKDLADAAVLKGDIAAAEQLRQIGIAVSDVLFFGTTRRQEIVQLFQDAEEMPINLSAFRDAAASHIDWIFERLGFGRNVPYRTTHTGGRKRFTSPNSPSVITKVLFKKMEEYVLDEDDVEGRAQRRRKIRKEINMLDKNHPDYPELLKELAFVQKLYELPKLTEVSYLDWAEVGAELMVDFRGRIEGILLPPIPAKWKEATAKRKGKQGTLRDTVRQHLQSGFEAIAKHRPLGV